VRDAAVVIVTWNNADCVADCLRSLDAAAARRDVEVLVVDNASSDGTPEVVSAAYPRARVVRNASNAGFAAANNIAFRQADARYFSLLNPDAAARPGAVDALVRFMDERPDVWAAGPAILNEDGTPQRTGVGFPSLWNMLSETLFLDRLFPRTRIFGAHRRLYEDPAAAREADFVQGSALMVRREVLDKVGGLDERFFLYFEETDWCFRIRKAGGKVMICPEAEVVHLGGGEFGHYDERRLLAYHRSLLAYFAKHRSLPARAALRVLLFARSLIRLGVWSGWALLRPGDRAKALSCARGYAKSLPLAAGASAPSRKSATTGTAEGPTP
jgi:GT2 family glycosyltransferase